jgi:nanoRNase/pAp phosphatase (c-di-AMP/oligoRNAs hydrolase)
MRFGIWNRIFNRSKNNLDILREEGTAILRYQDQLVFRITRKPDTLEIAGFKVPAVNCPILSSEIGNKLCQGKPFAVIWRETKGFRTYSLRSDDKGENVCDIAVAFGGGGHPHAAGFTVKAGSDIQKLPEKS